MSSFVIVMIFTKINVLEDCCDVDIADVDRLLLDQHRIIFNIHKHKFRRLSAN
jgi:hypothetical protein